MRDILYRAKRKDNKKWIYGSLLHQTDHYGDKCNKYFIIDGTSTQDYEIGYEYEVIPETIGQYTQLKDKNSTKIFEGDIIQWINCNNEINRKVVQYDPEWNRFCIWINGTESLGINKHLSIDIEDIEDIGNKFDNPELL